MAGGVIAVPGATPAVAQPDSAPPAADQQQQDSGRHELVGQRTSHAKVYENADGTLTAVVRTDPVHYKDVQGKWREIDPTLEPCPSANRCAFQNKSGPFSARFASSAADDEIVAIHDRSLKVAFGLDGASDSEPSVEDNRITYPDVMPGVDLTFDVAAGEVKESIVLHEPPQSPTTFRFPLDVANLTARERESGEIDFVNSRDEVEFAIPLMFMTDSSGDEHSREPALSEDVTQDVRGSGKQQVLWIEPSHEWLTDPDRVYPVTIDPTTTKLPSLDTFVQSNILNTSQAGSVELKAGTYDGGGTKARSLLKFPIGFLDGTVVDTAKLSLFNNHSWSCTDRRVQVYRVTDDWGSGVTWPNKPGFGANPVDGVLASKGYSASCPSGRLEFGVADLVRDWKSGQYPNYGFGIRAESETDNYGWKKFASNEAGHPPEPRSPPPGRWGIPWCP